MEHADVSWRVWQPGLVLEDTRSLEAVYQTLPGEEPQDIPGLIRLYENPESPYSFPGAIFLDRHDSMHIVLGRGLHNQDEAFVIGFTMGAATGINEHHAAEYQRIASCLYPKPFKWKKSDLIAYRLGFDYARSNKRIRRDMHLIDFKSRMKESIKDLRDEIGVNVAELWILYQCEKLLIRRSQPSARLALYHLP